MLFTIKEVAVILGVPETLIRTAIADKKIKCEYLGGKSTKAFVSAGVLSEQFSLPIEMIMKRAESMRETTTNSSKILL